MVDGFVEALSRQAFGATFSRAEAVKLAAMAWLRERQSPPPAATVTAPAPESLAAPAPSRITATPAPAAPPTTAPSRAPRPHKLPREVLERIAEERTLCEGLSLREFAQRLHDKGIYSAKAKDGSQGPANPGNVKKWLDQARRAGVL